ncbi:MAG: prepilin-type N-terminal cleavage/methylation domain-containing protein [Ghiorsea sp.]|nr:prepilin-type N-terminal cleavage/methylation domain-containing protein [Ghiorsea sp.]
MKGFTLIEVLLAIVVFSLIAAISWTALGPAGEGFLMLKDARTQLESQQWVGKQLRRDVSYLSQSEDKRLPVVRLVNDSRGDADFDELQLLIRDPMYPGLTLVRYYIDEESGQLRREAISPRARTHVEPIIWNLAVVESFSVEALDAKSGWKSVFNPQQPFRIPLAIRVGVRDIRGEMSWDLPVFIRQ